MIVRVGIGQVKQGRMKDLVAALDAGLYEEYRRLPGFDRVVLLKDTASGRVMSLSFWKTEQQLADGEAATAKHRLDLSEFFAAQRTSETFVVERDIRAATTAAV
jgi:heme-degrading monooxygenase HmoA